MLSAEKGGEISTKCDVGYPQAAFGGCFWHPPRSMWITRGKAIIIEIRIALWL